VRRFPLPLFLSIVLLTGAAIGQSPNGTMSGLVLDPSGRAIAGAEVLIVNDATGIRYAGATNGEGLYAVTSLPPGPYRIQVSKFGFKTLIKPDVVLNVQDALAINFTLPVGAIAETVTVEGGAPLVNTESAAVSTVIDRNFVASLPLNGRSFNTLLELTPGVVIAPQPNAQSPGQFSIAGQRADANTFTVDGVSANFGVSSNFPTGASGTGSAQAFSALGGTSSLVSVDSLQEFRIETSSFAAEFGRSPGGQVILTTRSGTNEFHGGLFDYFRNTVLDANDWFADNAHLPRAPEQHNDFGGYFGGPILRNKTFFFFSYEGARLRIPETSSIAVPSSYARAVAPVGLVPYVTAYPQPDDKTITPGEYISHFTANYSNQATLDATSIRIDHTLNSRFSIFGRYNNAPSQVITRSGPGNEVDTVPVNTRTLTLGLTALLSSHVSDTIRGNYSEQNSNFTSALDTFGGALPPDPSLLIGPLAPVQTLVTFAPLDGVASYQVGPSARNRTKQVNLVDDLSVTAGRHQLKFGADYRALFLRMLPAQNSLLYLISSVQEFVSGASEGQSLLFNTGTNLPSRLLSQSLSLYGQDNFHLTPRLTLTYGLRWELAPAPSARGGTTLASWSNTDNPAMVTLAPPGTAPWRTRFGNFAPRFGAAYRVRRERDLVLRAGVGVFYDLGVGSVANLGAYFPNASSQSASGVVLPVSQLPSYLPVISLQPPYPFATGFAADLELPRSYQWNVAMETSFAGQNAFSLTYVGQAGRDLLREEALYQPNSNFSGDFALTGNTAWSNYNALQAQYRRPLSQGLQGLLNYTWAHSLDNASNDVVAGLSGTVISAASDYGSSDFDVRQSFSGALIYAIPSVTTDRRFALLTQGWSLQSVIVARTGTPFNGVLLLASPDPGGVADSRPDRVLGQPVWLYGSQCISALGPPCAGGQGLNPAAFAIPSTVRQGTEARNDITGFGLTQVDLSIRRRFSLTDHLILDFRADAFNVLNHPNFGNPAAEPEFGPFYLQSQAMLNKTLGGLNPLFQQGGPRSLQLSLKLSF